MTYKVGAPIPITGVQFGMRVEFGYDCLIPADFNNDVSFIFALSFERIKCTRFNGITSSRNLKISSLSYKRLISIIFVVLRAIVLAAAVTLVLEHRSSSMLI